MYLPKRQLENLKKLENKELDIDTVINDTYTHITKSNNFRMIIFGFSIPTKEFKLKYMKKKNEIEMIENNAEKFNVDINEINLHKDLKKVYSDILRKIEENNFIKKIMEEEVIEG